MPHPVFMPHSVFVPHSVFGPDPHARPAAVRSPVDRRHSRLIAAAAYSTSRIASRSPSCPAAASSGGM